MCATVAVFADFKMADKLSKIGLLQACLVVQIQKIPKKLNDRKLKQSLNIAQEISWSLSSPTAAIFGSFV